MAEARAMVRAIAEAIAEAVARPEAEARAEADPPPRNVFLCFSRAKALVFGVPPFNLTSPVYSGLQNKVHTNNSFKFLRVF